MAAIANWFERKFDFHLSSDLAPNVCIRLRGTPARLEELTTGANAQELTLQSDDKWSAQEHAGHLLDMEPLWMARVEDFLQQRLTLTPADLTNRRTFEALHNQRPLAEILGAFRLARQALVDRVSGLDLASFSQSLMHPRLNKPMRLLDHLYFVAEHDDHHLAWIWRLLTCAAPPSK